MKLLLAILVWSSMTQAVAHHAYAAEFDEDKPIKLEGKIVSMEWVNPHAVIHVDVKSPDGSHSVWLVEGNSPNTLFRMGLTKKSISAGDEVIIEGYRARDNKNEALGAKITFKNGQSTFLGSNIEWPWPPRSKSHRK